MNKRGVNVLVIILVVFLIIAITASVFVFYNSPSSKTSTTKDSVIKGGTQSSTIKDCGTSIDCLISAANNCDKAKMEFTSNVDLFGIKQATTSYYELKGIQSNKCLFYFRTDDVNLQFSDSLIKKMKDDGASQSDIDKQLQESQAMATKLEGRDGTCSADSQRLSTVFNQWKEGSFSTSDFDNMDCSGKYFDPQI